MPVRIILCYVALEVRLKEKYLWEASQSIESMLWQILLLQNKRISSPLLFSGVVNFRVLKDIYCAVTVRVHLTGVESSKFLKTCFRIVVLMSNVLPVPHLKASR